jgi:hypothetical protein
VKIARLLLVVALLGFSASVILADGVDPLVGIGHGNGSTPITTPITAFTLVTAQSSVCTISGDVCGVIPPGMPDAGMIPVFQNDLGQTITTLTIFLQNGSIPLNYQCGPLAFFSDCTTVTVGTGPTGGTDVIFSGGTGIPALIFYADDDSDDSSCQTLGPTGPNCADDWVPTEFTVDIEGIITTDGTTSNDLPTGITIQGSVITSPEPSSALMLLFGMLALALTKIACRAA